MVRIVGHSTCDDLDILRPCDIDVPHMHFMKSHVKISKIVILLGKVTGNCKNMSRHVIGVYFMFWTRENSFWVQRTIILIGQPIFHIWNRHFGSIILKIWNFITFNEHTNTHWPSKQVCINCKQGETSLYVFILPLSNQRPCLYMLHQHMCELLHQNMMLQLDFSNDIRNP